MSAADHHSQIKNLIALGKEKGFLTYAEVSDYLPEIVDSEQMDDVISMIQGMSIPVHDEAPDDESRLFASPTVTGDEDDEDAAEEAAAALAAVDSEFGRTTDPVRMYMRTGSVVRPNSESTAASAAAASSAASSSSSSPVTVGEANRRDSSSGASSCTGMLIPWIMLMTSSICSESTISGR